MTPAPNRRSFRFSLRTLFVVVTVLCCWLGYELNWIRQRQQAKDWLATANDSWYAPSLQGAITQASVPWILRLLGEQGVVGIGMDVKEFTGPVPYTPAQLERLFPEAHVDWSNQGMHVIDAQNGPRPAP